MGKPETWDETRGSTKTSIPYETFQFWHFAVSKSTCSYEFSLEPENLQPQNRCFVRGFRQFSAHVTKCHACHGIWTLSPLDAALPMRFTKNKQHDTSKVLRLPRKMTMDTSKVLRLPRKLQHIFWKRHKSIAPATQNDFRHVPEHVWMSRSATPATRNEATRRLKPPKRTTSAKLPIGTAIRSSRERLRTVANGCERLRTVANGCGRLRTVANGCDHKRNVERTHPQPPDPQSETGTLATHSGKWWFSIVMYINVYPEGNIVMLLIVMAVMAIRKLWMVLNFWKYGTRTIKPFGMGYLMGCFPGSS